MMMAVQPPVFPQFGPPTALFACRDLPSFGQRSASSTRKPQDVGANGLGEYVAKTTAPAKVAPVPRVAAISAAPAGRREKNSMSDYLADAAAKPADKSVVKALEVVLSHIAVPVAASGDRSLFHAMRAPRMTIGDYFLRMQQYFDCSNECYVIAFVYIDRLAKRQPSMMVDNLSCHRLFFVSTVIALKFQDDDYHDNAYYAKVGGLSLKELNRLEREFVRMLDWSLHVDAEQYATYRDMMLSAVGTRADA